MSTAQYLARLTPEQRAAALAFSKEIDDELAVEADTPRQDIADAPTSLVVSELGAFLAEKFPPREPILAPIIMRQSLSMIHAWRGIGKTHVALGIAYAVASGGTFLRWTADRPRKVIFIDGEMPGTVLQDRLARIVATAPNEAPDGYFKLITPDQQSGAMPDLATEEGQEAVDRIVEQNETELIVVDNLSCLVRRGGKENEAESWLNVAEWALKHRARGRSVLFVHHSGKNGQQRGTSKREDLLDTVITLRRPPAYDPAAGAVFEVHFEKARGLYGKDCEPFEAKLTTDAQGKQSWATRNVIDGTVERAVELHNLGLSQKEIADELGLNKSSVCRAMKKAETEGKILPAKACQKKLQVARARKRNVQLLDDPAQPETQQERN